MMICGKAFIVICGVLILEHAIKVHSMRDGGSGAGSSETKTPYRSTDRYSEPRRTISEVLANDKCNEKKTILQSLGCSHHAGLVACKQALLAYVQLPNEERRECPFIRGAECRQLRHQGQRSRHVTVPSQCSFRVQYTDEKTAAKEYEWKPLRICYLSGVRESQADVNRFRTTQT